MVFNAGGGGQGYDLGSAYGKIVIDSSGIQSGIAQAQRSFDSAISGFGAGLSKLGGTISGLGSSLTVLTAPLAAFQATGVQAASRFQDALKEIQTRAGLTTDELERVRQKALDIGRDTQFSAGQGVEAFLQLLTSGQSVEEAFKTIDAVVQGAAASGEDLGFVSDGLTDVMAALNLRVEDVGGVLQSMSDAAASSSADFRDLVLGFQNVGGAAAQFGINMREQAGILALFAENGIKGAEAGTQLRSMLKNMSSQTDRTQNAWKRLGTSMFDATGKARPFGDVLEDIRKGLDGMTQQDRIQTLQDLGGAYGQLGLTALTTGSSLAQMEDQMDQGADVADVAAARMDTFSGSVAFLRGSIETFQINTLTPFMENTLRPMVIRIANIVNAMNEWATANPELANKLVGLVGLLISAGPAMFAVGKAVSFIGSSISALAPIIGLIASPIGVVVAGVSALAVGLDALGVIDLSQLQYVLNGILSTITALFAGEPFKEAMQGIGEMSNNLAKMFGASDEQAQAFQQEVWRVIDAFDRFIGATQNGVPLIDAALTLIGDLFGTEFEGKVKGALDGVRTFITEQVIPRLNDLRDWFTLTALPAITDFVTNTALPQIQAFLDVLEGAWRFVSVALQSLYNWFVVEALPKINEFIGKVKLTWDGLKRALMALWSVVKPWLQPIVDWFRDTFQMIGERYIKPVADWVQGVIDRVREAVDQLRILGGGAPNTTSVTAPPGYNVQFGANGGVYDRDSGGPMRPGDIALIGKGAQPEAFVAQQPGYMVPNADKLMGGGVTINGLTINASTYEGGKAAARGFSDELARRRRENAA